MSRSKGLVMKLKAPLRMASTAISMVPNAVITMTGMSEETFLTASRSSNPSMSPSLTSVITRSGDLALNSLSPL